MSNSWKSDNWDDFINGQNCPVCDLISSNKSEDAHGIYIADLSFSRLFLAKNQYVQGYCVLMCHRHVIEPYALTTAERTSYFNDMALVGRVLEKVFKADKLNYNILGNIIPHLHTHILPRYFTDDAPNRPIDPDVKKEYLSSEGYEERINLIRSHIKTVQ